ncbi:SdpI family protein [Brevundimonas sp. 2YAF1]|uniref:SdpI family protein n=1 Tax=Brevundimonas sp. 2YAF1 TaxID=3233024 RepID=UPI003F91DDBB
MTAARKPDLSLIDIASIVVTAAIAGAAAWVFLAGPTGPIPLHFNAQGVADRFGGRGELAASLLLIAGVGALACGGCALYAHKAEDPARRRGLIMGQLVALLAIGGASVLMLATSLGGTLTTAPVNFHMAGMGLLFLLIGAFLGRVGPNVGIGVRTPWSHKSRLAWDRSNRLAGRLFCLIGLAAILLSPFVPQPLGMQGVIAAVLIAALWSAFESWRVWRTDPDRQPF